MIVRLRVVTRRAMSWSFVLVSAVVPAQRASAQRVIGIIPDQRARVHTDSARMAAAMAMSARMRSPAGFALSRRKELGLSADQVAAFEALAPIEADSLRVRTQRIRLAMRRSTAARPAAAALALRSWSGPIDEAGIRAAACAQAQSQTELTIGTIRDRHAVGRLLTAAQRTAFDRLQGEAVMQALRGAPQSDK